MKNEEVTIISESETNSFQNDPIPLKTVANYYLSGKGLASKNQEIKQQILLLLVSLSGATNYILPAKDYADKYGNDYAGDPDLSKEVNYIIGTTVPALAVLYNATDIFLDNRRGEHVPEELKAYLNASGSRLKDMTTVTGSAVSSIPLALVSIAYPFPIKSHIGSIVTQTIVAVVIEIDNTVLHFLPLDLAMRYKIYRFPILPFELLTKKLHQTLRRAPQKITNQEAELIGGAVIQYLHSVKNRILLDTIFTYPRLVYEWGGWTQELQEIKLNSNNNDFLKILTNHFPQVNIAGIKKSSWLYRALGEVVGFGGACWVWSSCSGYILGPFNQLLAWTGSSAAAGVLVSPALYFFSVLLTFLGYSIGKNYYHYLTNWGPNESKLPLEFKLYPKTFTFIMMVNLYVNLYSYAAAEELVRDNFTEKYWDEISPVLIWLARTGIPFLGINAVKDCSATLLRKWAIHYGDETTQIVAKMAVSIEQMTQAMTIARREAFIASKEYLEDIGILEKKGKQQEVGYSEPQRSKYLNWITHKICFWRTELTESSSSKKDFSSQQVDNALSEITPLIQS